MVRSRGTGDKGRRKKQQPEISRGLGTLPDAVLGPVGGVGGCMQSLFTLVDRNGHVLRSSQNNITNPSKPPPKNKK